MKHIENKRLGYLKEHGIINSNGTYESIKTDKDFAMKLLHNKKCREALSIKDEDLDKSDITIDKKRGLTAYERTLEKVTRNINSDLHRPYSTNLKYVKAYCILFDCSADYLLGIEKEKNHDLHFIHKYTGLNEDAINTLSVLKEFNKNYDQYRKPVELEALNFIMKDFEKFREFVGYISALFIGADKAFYLDKEDKEWRYINDPIHIGFPTSKNSKEKQTFNTGMINIKSLAETDCIRHIELMLENWKQEFKNIEE